MNRLSKIAFCYSITKGLKSFFKLISDSRQLRLSKLNEHFFTNESINSITLDLETGVRPFFYRLYSGDLDIFYEVLYKRIYSGEKLNLPPNPVIVDLGANIGIASLHFINEYPGAKIIMVEPDPENFYILEKNFSREVKNSTVKLVQAAVMDFDGTIGFVAEKMKFNSHVSNKEENFSVPSISLSRLFAEYNLSHIHLLKIDVEGAEQFIFNSGYDWLNKVSALYVELHNDMVAQQVIRVLDTAGFAIKLISQNESGEKLILAKQVRT